MGNKIYQTHNFSSEAGSNILKRYQTMMSDSESDGRFSHITVSISIIKQIDVNLRIIKTNEYVMEYKKLTLSLNKKVIKDAKIYAKTNNISLSKLIESYLATLVSPKYNENKITPLVKSLSGIIDLPEEFDVKEAYSEFLIDKYK